MSRPNEELLLSYIKEHQEQFYRLAYSYAKNSEDALDIVQDAVVKAIEKQHTLRDPGTIRTWFYRILANTACSFLRHASRAVSIGLEEADLSSTNDEEHWNNTLAIQEALKQLNGKTRTVIILKFYENMTFAEIAQILRKPEASIKSIYYRGLKFLKERMQSHEAESSYPR